MYAYEIPNLRFSLPAGGAVAHRRFVSVSNGMAFQATGEKPVVGASMNAVLAAELANGGERVVELADGIVMVEAGGAITSGAPVYSDDEGRATGAGDANVVGIAITAATGAGELVAVKIN